jgi:uncharacterized membrane protein
LRKLQQIANRLATNRYSPVTQRVIDGLLSVVALWLAYETIFSGQVPTAAAAQMWGALLKIALGRLAMNELFRCYRSIWR